jgi:hypothetical protein
MVALLQNGFRVELDVICPTGTMWPCSRYFRRAPTLWVGGLAVRFGLAEVFEHHIGCHDSASALGHLGRAREGCCFSMSWSGRPGRKRQELLSR